MLYCINCVSYFQTLLLHLTVEGYSSLDTVIVQKIFSSGISKPMRDNETKIQQWNIWGKKLDVKTIIYCTTINSFNKTDINFLSQFWSKWWCKCCRRQFNSSHSFQINLSFWNIDHAKKCGIRNLRLQM